MSADSPTPSNDMEAPTSPSPAVSDSVGTSDSSVVSGGSSTPREETSGVLVGAEKTPDEAREQASVAINTLLHASEIESQPVGAEMIEASNAAQEVRRLAEEQVAQAEAAGGDGGDGGDAGDGLDVGDGGGDGGDALRVDDVEESVVSLSLASHLDEEEDEEDFELGAGGGQADGGDDAVPAPAPAAAPRASVLLEDYTVGRFGVLIPRRDVEAQKREERRRELALKKLSVKRAYRREQKWLKMIKDWGRVLKKRQAKLKRRVRKGVPDSFRSTVWPLLVGVKAAAASVEDPEYFENLVAQDASAEVELQIKKDKTRTMQQHVMFKNRVSSVDLDAPQGHGQDVLFSVLKAYALHNPEVAYCQGMSGITAVFVSYVLPDEAFWMLERLLGDQKYGELARLFVPGFPGLMEFLFVHDQLVRKIVPKVGSHFESLGIESTMYAVGWYSTIFSRLPIHIVVRILDILLLEGPKILFRMAIMVLRKFSPQLVGQSFERVMTFLQREVFEDAFFDDADEVIREALRVPVTRRQVIKLQRAYQASVAAN